MVRPTRAKLRGIMLRANAPKVSSIQGLVSSLGGMIAVAPQILAFAGIKGAVRCPAADCKQAMRGRGDAGDRLLGCGVARGSGAFAGERTASALEPHILLGEGHPQEGQPVLCEPNAVMALPGSGLPANREWVQDC